MPKVKLICPVCGKYFERYPSQVRGGTCSKKCADIKKQAKELDEGVFRFDASTYTYEKPHPSLGNYKEVELLPKAKLRLEKSTYNYFLFKNGIHDELTAYLYGVILTDGTVSVTDSARSNALRLKMADQDIIEIVSNAFNKNYFITNDGYYMFELRNNYLVHDLMALGCKPNKTEIANYPLIPDELDKHFIRGCFDGDGSWITTHKKALKAPQHSIRFCGNDLLLYGIYQKIKQHIGVVPQKVDYPNNYQMRSYCRLSYGQLASFEIRDWLYEGATYYGQRKYEKAMGA